MSNAHSRENDKLRKMVKFGVIAVLVVFLASTSHGLWFQQLKKVLYTPAEDNAYDRITANIESFEKQFAEKSKNFTSSITTGVKPAVLKIEAAKITEAQERINAVVAIKPACNDPQGKAARVALTALLTNRAFPEIQKCAKTVLNAIVEGHEKSKQQVMKKMRDEKKKIDDGECYHYVGTAFGLFSAKICSNRIAETVDRIVQHSITEINFPNFTNELDQTIKNCKQSDADYQALETSIAAATKDTEVCLVTP